MGVRESEGVSEDGLDRSPDLRHVEGKSIGSIVGEEGNVAETYVDDLKALLEKLVGFIGEVVLDTVL